MNRKEITSEWIDRFNEGLLKEDELESFKKQLAIDPLLRLETRMDAELNRLLADRNCIDFMDQLNSVMHKDPPRKTSINLYLLAAGLLLLVSVAAFLFYYEMVYKPVNDIGLAAAQSESQPSGKQESVAVHDQLPVISTQAPVSGLESLPSNLLAEAYQPFPQLDMLSGSVLRSSPIWIQSPPNGTVYRSGEKISFRWTGTLSVGVNLVILNNKGIAVYEKENIDKAGFTLNSDWLPDGLLYWKIIEKDNLVAAGKIVVR